VSEIADTRFMHTALALARAQLGRTRPNPAVGCVLTRDGQIIAAAATDDGGRPHAERRALDQIGNAARGATAYVTLEPCAHYGQTPPCALGLIEAEISRVVVACLDHDSRVSGEGIAMLERAGIPVSTGLLEAQALPLYEGFFHRLKTGQPALYVGLPALGFDGDLGPLALSELDAHLTELGDAGAARIRVAPDHPLAAHLLDSGKAKPV